MMAVVAAEAMRKKNRCPVVGRVLVPTAEECPFSKFRNWMIGFASPISGTRRRCHMLPASTDGKASADDNDFETKGLEERDEEDDDEADDERNEEKEEEESGPEPTAAATPEANDADFDDEAADSDSAALPSQFLRGCWKDVG